MTSDDLKSEINSFLETLLQWFQRVRHPLRTCDRTLGDDETEHARIKRAMKIWGSSFIISVFALVPAYRLAGVEPASLFFPISVFLYLTGSFFVMSGVIHFGLRRDGVRSRFGDTLLIYSLLFGTFFPFYNLAMSPGIVVFGLSLKVSKAHSLGLSETIMAAFRAYVAPSPAMNALFEVAFFVETLLTLGVTGMFAQAVAKYYETDRQRVLSSLSFSVWVLGTVPVLIFTFLYYYAIASFVG